MPTLVLNCINHVRPLDDHITGILRQDLVISQDCILQKLVKRSAKERKENVETSRDHLPS